MSELDGVYLERTRCTLALARAAQALGHHAGFAADLDAPGWPVLLIDLPTGQVSWHVRAEDRATAPDLGSYEGAWDGHTTGEKYSRLDAWRPGGGET